MQAGRGLRGSASGAGPAAHELRPGGLYRALPRLRDTAKVLPYLRTAVVNRSRSVLRARRRAALRRVPHEPPVWSAESAAMASEERRAVLAAVSRMPARAREVLALRY